MCVWVGKDFASFALSERVLRVVSAEPRGARREQVHERDTLRLLIGTPFGTPLGTPLGTLDANLAEVRGSVFILAVNLRRERGAIEQPSDFRVGGFRRRHHPPAICILRIVRPVCVLRVGHDTPRAVHENLRELGAATRLRRLFAHRRLLRGVGILFVFNHQTLNREFGLGHGHDPFLDRPGGDELVHGNFARLAHPVRPRLRLQVDERVEIGIVKDDGVGGGEVKS